MFYPVSMAEPFAPVENEAYLTQQLITYIGNKRSLLDFIGNGIKSVQQKLNKTTLSTFDVFSGSGIVARYFKRFSGLLIANDLERYSEVINGCYLSNQDELDLPALRELYKEITEKAAANLQPGIITELYAPKDENNIQPNDRVFYTRRNAMYIDTVRTHIDSIPSEQQKFFLAPLLSEASIHVNTSGVFKGFYKNRDSSLGQYGGKNGDALFRIKGDITLPFPVLSHFNCETIVLRGNANEVIREVPEVDLAYLDPPYNQHPYGSNYFMLNVILDNKHPQNTSEVSGIPDNWNRSAYNKESGAYEALRDLAANIKAKFVLLSFNSEGFISLEQMTAMLNKLGRVEVLETKYNTFRGSRNLNERDIHVTEYLYLLEKK
jgi:adenine-specific DNA-methyltransferase